MPSIRPETISSVRIIEEPSSIPTDTFTITPTTQPLLNDFGGSVDIRPGQTIATNVSIRSNDIADYPVGGLPLTSTSNLWRDANTYASYAIGEFNAAPPRRRNSRPTTIFAPGDRVLIKPTAGVKKSLQKHLPCYGTVTHVYNDYEYEVESDLFVGRGNEPEGISNVSKIDRKKWCGQCITAVDLELAINEPVEMSEDEEKKSPQKTSRREKKIQRKKLIAKRR